SPLLARSTASYWSSKTALLSYSSRPISVLLPSSTEPAVAIRRMSLRATARSWACSAAGECRSTGCWVAVIGGSPGGGRRGGAPWGGGPRRGAHGRVRGGDAGAAG